MFGSGTFGCSINMGNEPDWNNRVAFEYSLNAGSFGSFGNNLFFRTGNRHVQFHFSVISSEARNNFAYRDIYRYQTPVLTAAHNAFRTWGFIQNLYLNLGNGHYLKAGIWFQHKVKELPPLMGSYHENNAIQRDSMFRSFISYRKTAEKSVLVIKSAWFSDYLHYTDKLDHSDSSYSVNSRIAARRFMNEADYR
jgi:iron complex outermembrane receptor protein